MYEKWLFLNAPVSKMSHIVQLHLEICAIDINEKRHHSTRYPFVGINSLLLCMTIDHKLSWIPHIPQVPDIKKSFVTKLDLLQ